MQLRHCCGSSPVCSGGFFPQLCLFFIFSPFDKLQNQVDNKNTGKNVQQGAQGAVRWGTEYSTDQGQETAPPRPGSVGSGPRLPSQLLGFLTEHSRISEGSVTTWHQRDV